MTREEAIAFGNRVIELGFKGETQAFCELAIKALKQEHCEDAVSRKAAQEAAVDVIAKYIPILIGRFENIPLELVRAIKDLSPATPTQRWIPCSERLPKESGFYLVSTTDCITIMEFCKEWISQNIGSCNWYVKAWMPLPEPYKAEKEDEE